MKLLLKTSDKLPYSSRKHIGDLAGTWVDVETDHLFNNQYNIVQNNLRVMDESVERIEDDARVGIVKCGYCGRQYPKGGRCNKYRDQVKMYLNNDEASPCDSYPQVEFTPKNTYFLKYPLGYSHTRTMWDKHKDKLKGKKPLGSYQLEFDGEYFRLSNCRKRFDFKYDGKFIMKGHYEPFRKHLDIPESINWKLKQFLNLFLED